MNSNKVEITGKAISIDKNKNYWSLTVLSFGAEIPIRVPIQKSLKIMETLTKDSILKVKARIIISDEGRIETCLGTHSLIYIEAIKIELIIY